MRLFHWQSQGMDLMVVADSEEAARAVMIANVNGWRWQDPSRFDAVLADLVGAPRYVAEPGHVITLDSQR